MTKAAPKKPPQININLIPREELSGPWGNVVNWSLGIGKTTLIILEILAIIVFAFSIKLNLDKKQLQETTLNKTSLLQTKAKIEKEIRAFQNKLANIKSVQTKKTPFVSILEEVEKRLPTDVVLSELRIESGTLILSGNLQTAEGLQALIISLRESKLVKNLEISQLNVPTAQTPLYSFTANAKLGEIKE